MDSGNSSPASSAEDAAKAKRFQILAILLTALLTGGVTWLISFYTLNRQFQDSLNQRRYATTNDLVTFLKQQDILGTNWLQQQDVQYTNWLREQSVQFTNWLKQQTIVDAKRDADAKLEREEWQLRQEKLFKQRIEEIKQTQAGGQTYWEQQQRNLYAKEYYDRQEKKLTAIREDYVNLWGVSVRAREIYEGYLEVNWRGGGTPFFLWPTKRYKAGLSKINQFNACYSEFEKQKQKLEQDIELTTSLFSMETFLAGSNTVRLLYKEPMLMVSGDSSWTTFLTKVETEKISPDAKIAKAIDGLREAENQRLDSEFNKAYNVLIDKMASDEVVMLNIAFNVTNLWNFQPPSNFLNPNPKPDKLSYPNKGTAK